MFGFNIAVLLGATILLPSVIGFVRFRSLPKAHKFLAILLIIGLFCEGCMVTMAFYKKNNLLVGHVYRNVEIILMSFFLIHQLKNSNEKKIIRIALIGLSIFSIGFLITGDPKQFNSLPMVLEAIYFSAVSSYLFYKEATDPQPDVNASFYILNGAILFYFSSNFLFFAFFNRFINDHQNLLVMSNVHTIVYSIVNVIYATGLWIASRSSYSVA